jgi:hypothetical protein
MMIFSFFTSPSSGIVSRRYRFPHGSEYSSFFGRFEDDSHNTLRMTMLPTSLQRVRQQMLVPPDPDEPEPNRDYAGKDASRQTSSRYGQ